MRLASGLTKILPPEEVVAAGALLPEDGAGELGAAAGALSCAGSAAGAEALSGS